MNQFRLTNRALSRAASETISVYILAFSFYLASCFFLAMYLEFSLNQPFYGFLYMKGHNFIAGNENES